MADRDLQMICHLKKVKRKLVGLVRKYGEPGLIELCNDIQFLSFNSSNAGTLNELVQILQQSMQKDDAEYVKKIYTLRYGLSGVQKLQQELEAEISTT